MVKKRQNKIDRFMFILVVAALAIALVNVSLILTKFSDLFSIAGLATSTGTVNVSIESSISINFTASHINWSYGMVDNGATNSTLYTDGPLVLNGNWSTTGVSGLVLENIGTTNITLSLSAGKTAAELIGGASPSPEYQWNFSNSKDYSCTNHTGTNLSLTYHNANASIGVCDVFNYLDDRDEIRIDFRLVIPYNSLTGVRYDTITATGSAI